MGSKLFWIACVLGLMATGGCTPGAATAPNAHQPAAGNAIVIGMSLIKYGQLSSPFGTVQAYNPAFLTVPAGSTIQFHNEDGFKHTATMISGSFPSANTFNTSALTSSGADLATTSWSSGDLDPNGFSQTFATLHPGTYLYGCYHHYPAMRGVIIVQ